MQLEILTKSDLQSLRDEIISAIRNINPAPQPAQEFLRSSEVRKILKCSHATLQNLRISGTLKPTKVGGSWYYKASEIYNILHRSPE